MERPNEQIIKSKISEAAELDMSIDYHSFLFIQEPYSRGPSKEKHLKV